MNSVINIKSQLFFIVWKMKEKLDVMELREQW